MRTWLGSMTCLRKPAKLPGPALPVSIAVVTPVRAVPTADEVFMSRFLEGYGRLPTFDESAAFRIELEQQVSDYLTKHPDLSTSPRASQFTFHRRVSVGMSKEEVALLAGTAKEATQEEEPMRTAARQFWPAVKQRAKEMWVYPGGWQFYFDGDRLVDLTVFGKPPL